jgi:hypothetical protein
VTVFTAKKILAKFIQVNNYYMNNKELRKIGLNEIIASCAAILSIVSYIQSPLF